MPSNSDQQSGARSTERQSGDNAHANAVAAQLRAAEEAGDLPEDFLAQDQSQGSGVGYKASEAVSDNRVAYHNRLVLDCPVDGCEFACVDEHAMDGHLNTRHDNRGRYGPVLLSDGGAASDPEKFREHLLRAAEARDDERLRAAEEALLQALSDVRRDLQMRVADPEEVCD